jgi:hypothetical protein
MAVIKKLQKNGDIMLEQAFDWVACYQKPQLLTKLIFKQ